MYHLYCQVISLAPVWAAARCDWQTRLIPNRRTLRFIRLWRPLYTSVPQGFASKNCDIQRERAVYQSSIRHIAHVGTLTASNPRELNWQHVEHVGITVHRSPDRAFFSPPLFQITRSSELRNITKGGSINALSWHSICRSTSCTSYVQSARSSDRFHGEREGRAAGGPPPWTGSLCEQPESPQC